LLDRFRQGFSCSRRSPIILLPGDSPNHDSVIRAEDNPGQFGKLFSYKAYGTMNQYEGEIDISRLANDRMLRKLMELSRSDPKKMVTPCDPSVSHGPISKCPPSVFVEIEEDEQV
jgi:hypothetical protein